MISPGVLRMPWDTISRGSVTWMTSASVPLRIHRLAGVRFNASAIVAAWTQDLDRVHDVASYGAYMRKLKR